jgi:hypothetical protein
MKLGRSTINELCYAAEGLSGTAAASSLRKLGSIMELAPSGRLFGAISTLSDMSAKAAQALEDGSRALDRARMRMPRGIARHLLIWTGWRWKAQAAK